MTTQSAPDVNATEEPTTPAPRSNRAWMRTLLLQFGALAIFLAVWELLTATGVVANYLLPRASEVMAALWRFVSEILTGGRMLGHFFTTLYEVVLGFVGSVIVGTLVGAAISESRLLRRAVYPYIVALNATPRIAFAPLFVIWFGFGYAPKVVMAIAIATFPVIVNTIAGLNAADRDEIKLMRALGSTRLQTLTKLRIPAAMPYFFAGFETAMLFSAVGVVIGEFMSGDAGLGYVTLVSQDLFRLDDAFAAIVLLSVQGFLLHRLVVVTGRRLVFWQVDAEQTEPA